MEFSLEIAAYLAFAIANISALFFVKSRLASIVVISLSIFLFILINSLSILDERVFLKISFALVIFLVTANYVFSQNLVAVENSLNKVSKTKVIFLAITFISLFFTISYLEKSISQNSIDNAKTKISYLTKDKSNLLSKKPFQISKIHNIFKNNFVINNLTLIILLSLLLPLILTNLSSDEHL